MSCPSPDRILDYLARRLDAAERSALHLHVDGCAACRALLVDLVRTGPDEAVIPPVAEPERIGRYELERRLGEGGMGTVYAAHDPQLDRKLAVKLLHPELVERGGVERLLREGRALARLDHPCVVRVYDSGVAGDQLYIAMELVDGGTLATWLREAPRHWRDITAKFVAAGRGIAAAHHAGIIHRDVKPENVLLDRSGQPKVADFGLADPGGAAPATGRATTAAALPAATDDAPPPDIAGPAARITRRGAVLGTLRYMSPEQRRGQPVGPATDQYSLCAALASALFDTAPERVVPGWLRRAIARGCAADPAARFASIEQLIAALDPARRARRHRSAVLAGLGALAATAAVVFGVIRSPDAVGAACDAATRDRARLWSPADRSAVQYALLATRVPYATASWTRVDTAVADYLKPLAEAEAETCARAPRSPDALAAFDDGLACLAERRAELSALVTRLRDVAPADVRIAVALVHDLPAIDDCRNPATLAAEHLARATPAAGVQRDAIARTMRAAREARAAGRFREAADQAARAVELARPAGGVILVKALLARAESAMLVEGSAAREAAAREAATVAEAVHADGLRALALADLMGAMAREAGREREALAFAPLVEAAIARADRRAALTPLVEQARGMAQLRLGQTEAAVDSLRRALASAQAALPPDDPRMPEYLYPVGVALSMLGRDRDALAFHEQAYQVATAAWGTGHPNTARFAINLATKHAALGDCPKALDELARARALLVDVLPPESPEHLQIAQAMGACYYMEHRHADALREYGARQTALERAGRTRSVEMAGSWVDLGDVQFDQKDYRAARASYERSVHGYEDVVGASDARLGLPLSRLGETELALDHRDRAIEVLERAVAIYRGANAPPFTIANAAFPLARALWDRPAMRDRARALARTARVGWADAGPAYHEQIVALDAWLHAR